MIDHVIYQPFGVFLYMCIYKMTDYPEIFGILLWPKSHLAYVKKSMFLEGFRNKA